MNNVLVVWLIIIAFFIPTMLALWHMFTHSFGNQKKKLMWMGATMFLPPFGGICYMLWGRKNATGKTDLRLL